MNINTRFTIAVHIITLIAFDGSATSERMAASVGNHPVAVRQVISQLKKAGLVETQNGIARARLKRPQEEISLYDIYKAVEKDETLFNVHPDPNQECPVGRNILSALDAPLMHAQAAMENALKEYSLKDITAYIVQENSERRRSL